LPLKGLRHYTVKGAVQKENHKPYIPTLKTFTTDELR
jgi:hypothetical protein